MEQKVEPEEGGEGLGWGLGGVRITWSISLGAERKGLEFSRCLWVFVFFFLAVKVWSVGIIAYGAVNRLVSSAKCLLEGNWN